MTPTDYTPETIRALRERLGLTQNALAIALGFCGGQVVAQWEQGRAKPGRLARIALAKLEGKNQTKGEGR